MVPTWLVAAVAAVCALTAAAIPTAPWAEDIYVEQSALLGQEVDADEIVVRIDDRQVVVHAPEGFAVGGWGSSSDGEVAIALRQLAGTGTIGVVFGRGAPPDGAQLGERDGRPIIELVRGGGIAWQVVTGAVVIVRSPAEPIDVLADVLEAIEVR